MDPSATPSDDANPTRQGPDRDDRRANQRGYRSERCGGCRLSPSSCVCPWRPRIASTVRFLVLTHPVEAFKPTSTGRVVASCVAGSRIESWSRESAPSELRNPRPGSPGRGAEESAGAGVTAIEWALVFPARQPDLVSRCVAPPDLLGRGDGGPGSIGLVLLDGTWPQARRMCRKSRWLERLPILSLDEVPRHGFRLRRSAQLPDRACTADAAIRCMELLGDESGAERLAAYYHLFTLEYLRMRKGPGAVPDPHLERFRQRSLGGLRPSPPEGRPGP